MSATENLYVKNGPLLELVDGHYPAFKNIKGLDFDISIVLQASNMTTMDGINRQLQAEHLVYAWNRHDPLTDELGAARALLSELIDIEGPQPGTAAWAEKVRAFLAGEVANG